LIRQAGVYAESYTALVIRVTVRLAVGSKLLLLSPKVVVRSLLLLNFEPQIFVGLVAFHLFVVERALCVQDCWVGLRTHGECPRDAVVLRVRHLQLSISDRLRVRVLLRRRWHGQGWQP